MSRDRDSEGNDVGRPTPAETALGQQIRNELAGILKLLLRNAACHSVTLLDDHAHLTRFSTGMDIEDYSVDFEQETVRVSPDAISALRRDVALGGQHLLQPELVVLHNGLSLSDAEAARNVHTLRLFHPPCADRIAGLLPAEGQLPIHKLPIEAPGANNALPESWLAKAQKPMLDMEDIHRLPVSALTTQKKSVLVKFQGKRQSITLLTNLGRKPAKKDARLKLLPIQKNALPPHRFSTEMRQTFRQALAQKYGLSPDNIQLTNVFDRMVMGAYGSLRPSTQGGLLCTPKADVTNDATSVGTRKQNPGMSRPGASYASRGNSDNNKNRELSYLITGIRLDNRQDIQTIVPQTQRSPEETPPAESL